MRPLTQGATLECQARASSVFTLAGPAGSHSLRYRREKYSPYAIDWRFLPDEALLIKDFIRHNLVKASNYAATRPALSRPWIYTLGFGPLQSVRRAKHLFIHIPKTGGTSISKVLFGKNLPHYTAQFWHDVYGTAVVGIPSFSVIRHPVDRLISAYNMIIAGGTGIMSYSYYFRHRIGKNLSFDSLINHISENMGVPDALPPDLRPQSDFILDPEGRVMVDRLFCFRDDDTFPKPLAHFLGCDTLPHINVTLRPNLSVSDEQMRNIKRLYERDFCIYEYLLSTGCHAILARESII